MILLANVLGGLATVLHTVLRILIFIVFGNAILSWVNPDPRNPIVRFLNDVTTPLLKPIRKYVRPIGPGIDLSPMILLLVILFLDFVLVGSLIDYSNAIRSRSY